MSSKISKILPWLVKKSFSAYSACAITKFSPKRTSKYAQNENLLLGHL
jgi:hypothetical protein